VRKSPIDLFRDLLWTAQDAREFLGESGTIHFE